MVRDLAGYSGTPLAKKLGIKPGGRVVLVQAPGGFEDELEGLPDDVTMSLDAAPAGQMDVIVLFTTSRSELEDRLPDLGDSVFPAGGLWIAWPKRSSKVPTDLTEDVLREVVLPTGMVDNKVCAVNEVWSGLRFVWRRELRSQKRPGRAVKRRASE